MDTNKPETTPPAPAALPLSHQDHPVWSFLGNFSLALLKFGIAAAPAAAGVFTKDPKIEAAVELGSAALGGAIQQSTQQQ